MSDHSTLLASRVKTPELNKWCYDFAASKKYAVENRVPFIAIWTEGDGCGHCQILASCLVQSHFKTWMGSSGCIFWLGAAEDKWADNKEGQQSAGFMWASRALDVRTYPFVRVYWEPGKIDRAYTGNDVDGGLTGADGGTKLLVSKLTSVLKDYDPNAVPASPADDIRLLSGKNGCTAQTDPDVTEKDDIAISSKWLSNRLYTHYACASGPDGYPFSGWSSHSSTGMWLADKGPAFGVKTALADIKKLSEANGRPLFVVYGKAGNKGSCAFNRSFDEWSRAGTGALTQLSKCQEGAADPSLKLGNRGFYFVYYFNDKDETCPEANEAKKFITQFGDIKTGYPWYIAYCKYQDKHVYARYGSLPSANVLAGGYVGQNEDIAAIYGDFCTFAKSRGQEIQYTWTGGQGSAPRGDGVFASRKTGVAENFVTGQWYEFGTGGLQKFIDYAYATSLPVIAVGSTANRRCRKFETEVLDRPELAAWLAEQDCLLLYCQSEDGKWDSGDAKLFADTFGAGDVPMVRVWCDGKTYMKETF